MASEPIIHLEKVSIYQKHNMVLNNVSIDIDKGEFVYLVGRTGSGKSSLLKTLYAELPLSQGTATIAGFDLRTIRRKEIPFLRRKLGIVFQDFQLLTDRTVNANLEFVMKATGWTDKQAMQARMQDVLEKVGLGTKGFKMPHELSGG
jgi:cell division transport system ATP-binding protein